MSIYAHPFALTGHQHTPFTEPHCLSLQDLHATSFMNRLGPIESRSHPMISLYGNHLMAFSSLVPYFILSSLTRSRTDSIMFSSSNGTIEPLRTLATVLTLHFPTFFRVRNASLGAPSWGLVLWSGKRSGLEYSSRRLGPMLWALIQQLRLEGSISEKRRQCCGLVPGDRVSEVYSTLFQFAIANPHYFLTKFLSRENIKGV